MEAADVLLMLELAGRIHLAPAEMSEGKGRVEGINGGEGGTA